MYARAHTLFRFSSDRGRDWGPPDVVCRAEPVLQQHGGDTVWGMRVDGRSSCGCHARAVSAWDRWPLFWKYAL